MQSKLEILDERLRYKNLSPIATRINGLDVWRNHNINDVDEFTEHIYQELRTALNLINRNSQFNYHEYWIVGRYNGLIEIQNKLREYANDMSKFDGWLRIAYLAELITNVEILLGDISFERNQGDVVNGRFTVLQQAVSNYVAIKDKTPSRFIIEAEMVV